MQYHSLQLRTLLPSPVNIHNWVLFLLWLHLFIFSGVIYPSSPVAYWAPTNLGNSSFSVLYFCLFILFRGFSRQEYWSGLPFPSPVDHVLSELYGMTHPSWVALHGMAHSFIELDKAVVHVISLVSFLWLWRNNSRKNEEMESKQKQHPVLDVTGNGSKVRRCRQQSCIGTRNARSMNQG